MVLQQQCEIFTIDFGDAECKKGYRPTGCRQRFPRLCPSASVTPVCIDLEPTAKTTIVLPRAGASKDRCVPIEEDSLVEDIWNAMMSEDLTIDD